MNKTHPIVAVFFFGVLALGVWFGIHSTPPQPTAISSLVIRPDANNQGTAGETVTNDLGSATRLPEPTNATEPQVLGWSITNTFERLILPRKKPNKNTNHNTNGNTNTSVNVNENIHNNRNTNTPSNNNNNTNTVTNLNTNTSTNTNTPPLASGEIRFSSYNTSYGWPDNTPPGAEISEPVIHTTAGGIGTYQDPITVAVGHSIINGQDILDYPAGTKFYIPAFRRYFIVEDTCGDGNLPQNGPCHISSVANTVQLDLWVGGQGAVSSAVLNCESKITGVHLAIKNPAANYMVVSGPIYNGTCSQLYGDTVVTQ